MVGIWRIALRALLWPLKGWGRALSAVLVLASGLGWLCYEYAILDLLGLGRPAERSVEMRLRVPGAPPSGGESALTAWEERYGGLEDAELSEVLDLRRTDFESLCDEAFETVRERGDGRPTEFARTGMVPTAPGAGPTVITRVVLDPEEVSGRRPAALTLELERDEWPDVYRARDELDWLEVFARQRVGAAPPEVVEPAVLLEASGAR